MLLGAFHHLNALWFINFTLKIASLNQVSPLFFFLFSSLDIMDCSHCSSQHMLNFCSRVSEAAGNPSAKCPSQDRVAQLD